MSFEERLVVDTLATLMTNLKGDGIEVYDKLVSALDRFELCSKLKRLEIYMRNLSSPPIKSSVVEAPIMDLKDLPSHLR